MTKDYKYIQTYRDAFEKLTKDTKRRFLEFFSRITELKTPIGSVTWNPKPDERVAIYEFSQNLYDHRLVIGIGHMHFSYIKVIDSLESARELVTKTLVLLGPDFEGRELLERIRAAFQYFQGLVEKEWPEEMDKERSYDYHELRGIFIESCSAMQGAVGVNLGELARIYEIELSERLVHEFRIPDPGTQQDI